MMSVILSNEDTSHPISMMIVHELIIIYIMDVERVIDRIPLYELMRGSCCNWLLVEEQ